MNIIAGVECPSVVCLSGDRSASDPAFRWQAADGSWHLGDELPADIEAALPPCEQQRCLRHRWRRKGY